MYKCGSIDLLDNENGNFLSKAIRFFTNSTISHTDFTMGKIVKEESVLSAQALMSVLPLCTYFWDEYFTFTIYEIEGVPEKELEKIVRAMYIDFAGKKYGFMQLPWFIYRWFMERLGKDVRKQHNWFAKNNICSELVWMYLVKVSKGRDYGRFPELYAKLNEWNRDTVSPQDIKVIVESFPEIFVKKTFCEKTVVHNF